MAKDRGGSPKPHINESKKKRLIWIFGVSSLCVLFYIIGASQNKKPSIFTDLHSQFGFKQKDCSLLLPRQQKSTSGTKPPLSSDFSLDFESHHHLVINTSDGSLPGFPVCDMAYSEITPCHDPKRARKFDRAMFRYKERHCPPKEELMMCLVPAPPKYKTPFKWPRSRDHAWFNNIPHKELSIDKAKQNWIQLEGEYFKFPGGGTMFSGGADTYIYNINNLIPLSSGNIRTVLDTGCGVASWGACLLKRDIIAMSFAPRDTHKSQVHFALERGLPAMIGIMGSQRLPYPARAFDLAHCSRCMVPWTSYSGIYLLEIDRILRPGGYWILSGPPIRWKKHWKGWGRSREDLRQEQDSIEAVTKNLCWKKVVEKGDLSIWQKPINHVQCIKLKKVYPTTPMCGPEDADAAWYKDMEGCITRMPEARKPDEVSGGRLQKWPVRAFSIPPRISSGSVPGITDESFKEDNELWKNRVSHYMNIIEPLQKGRYRNVMDMNAYLGGFAAALMKYPVWVMNVVPAGFNPNTLGIVYERGFIGTYHDWCEAFSTYPRTYDLIHAERILSMYKDRCDITYILLEMDRILRPEGTVIFRDMVEVLVKVQETASRMKWQARIMDHETGPFNPEKILVAIKTYWTGEAADNKN